ncbi:MAG: 4-(cytidine 5'-diphospho)-2-C-methyl-D-erythritol kinase [Candidatus Eisenbacteria bacterium]|nr:4-(cytidine 5'-diphospho)-2-C-methyl-D-erythritol kinase [Candidatus Eisenbacteria bacterium]
MSGSFLRFRAFAKTNLFLEILGKREDGYHDIRSLMVNVDLADTLEFRRIRTDLTLKCDSGDVPSGPGNLCLKAARVLKEYANHRGGAEITLEKSIPVAAGLGGGSSDAACTLVGLSKLWGLSLTEQKLQALGEKIGSDVPFFIRGGAQLVEGRGERLTPVESFPEAWFVLVTPSLRISSGWAYSVVKIGLTKAGHKSKIMIPGAGLDEANVRKTLRNDLESGVIETYPVVHELKDALISSGAIGSLMSGSGPTVFGVARGRTSATAIATRMSRLGLFVSVVRTVRTGWVELSWN